MPLLYYDNTRISTYRECNRKFYLRHIRDLTPEGDRVDLIFGQAWHEAMNVVWRGLGIDKKTAATVAKEAFLKFTAHWTEKGLPDPQAPDGYQIITDRWPTKNPWVALEMLANYIKQREGFIRDCTEIEIERPFAVPLGITIPYTDTTTGERTEEEVFYIGRLDKTVKHKQHGRLVVEHKTTGWYAKEGGFRSDYLESFSPNSQVDGYLFVGNSLFEGGLKGLWVDAALTHKSVHDKFKFIPIDRQFAALDAWLIETRIYVRRIVEEMNALEAGNLPEGPFPLFPKNTGSCHTYAGCSFRDICKYVPDPRRLTLPGGFKVERWEPFDLLKIGEIMKRKGD